MVAPLGISFYSFQALGYLFDVYYKRIKAERNFLHYVLFVSFFPQLISGPISKAGELLPQIKKRTPFDYSKAVVGLKCLLWGMFMKVVIADRLGVFVDNVWGNLSNSTSFSCILACIFYSFQIYGDFAGYSLMAVGVGKIMGFDLINNFNHPYFAISITDFWRRWHISLSRWLKDYVYIPLGGSRCSKIKNYSNIMTTFLVSGIWHGANWTFILWGVLHGLFQCVEKILGFQKYDVSSRKIGRFIRIGYTFIAVTFAWILFRSPDIDTFCAFISNIANFNGMGFDAKFGASNALVVLLPLFLLILSGINEEFFNNKYSLFESKNTWIRWGGYISVMAMILLFGMLDSGKFIYANF